MRDDMCQIDSRRQQFLQVRAWPGQAWVVRRRLLKRLCAGEQFCVATKTADHLQPEWHAFMIGAAGQGQRGVGGQGDGVTQRQPAVVVVQWFAVDFAQVQLAPGERRHRCGRGEDNVVVFELLLEAAKDSALFAMCLYAVLQRHRYAHVEIGSGVGAQRFRVAVVGVLQAGDECFGAQDVEGTVGTAQVQVDGFAGLEQRFQCADLFPEDCTNMGVHRAGAEIFAVADPQLAEVYLTRSKFVSGDGIAQWVGLRQPGAGTQLQQGVGDVAAHRADDGNGGPAEFLALARHQARRRAQADDAAQRGGNSQRATGVRAAAQWHHIHRQRSGRATLRTACIQFRVERVAGCAPDHVAGVGAGAQFRHVGLAEHDCPGSAQAGDEQVVLGGYVVAEQWRAVGGEYFCGFFQVLDADWQTMQQAQRFALHHRLFGADSLASGAVKAGRGKGVDFRIEGLDALDTGVEQLHWRDLFAADQRPQFGGGFAEKLGRILHGVSS
ncbi:hypothetical protein ALQ25_05608 [Pseudomonas coronafaciens pv. atropurpurea]|nr:hypothetical protein ALQ25_05608 [Pseudomonas coronafaciens pv. atropurpurea]